MFLNILRIICEKYWTIYSILNLIHEENKKSLHVPQKSVIASASDIPPSQELSLLLHLQKSTVQILCHMLWLVLRQSERAEMLQGTVHKFLLWPWVSQDPCSFCNHKDITSSTAEINMTKCNINILSSVGI